MISATLSGNARRRTRRAQPALTEIIVTAQKRQENIQDVPVSVMALSGQQLQDAGVKDIKNLQVLTPGVTVTSTTSENVTTARIRGIGTVGDNPGLESSVGVIIDGVYRARNGVGFGDLGEIERIEVLEGPQGELFGKNNDAGVINVVTKRPSSTFGVTAEATGGNYNDREISASVTGPSGDISAARFYAGYQRRDGFLNVDTGPGPNTENNTDNRNVYTLRGQYLLTPNDNVSFLVIADYSKRNESCCGAIQTADGPFYGHHQCARRGPAARRYARRDRYREPAARRSSDRNAWANQPIVQHIRDMGVSGQLDWDLGFGKVHLDLRVARQHAHRRQRCRLHRRRYRSRARQRGQSGRFQADQPGIALGRQERVRSIGWWADFSRTSSSSPTRPFMPAMISICT